ncbi:MAG: prepilin peptidase [Pseudomonadota bacterium]
MEYGLVLAAYPLLFILLLAFAAGYDLATLRIPNWLNALIAVSFFVSAVVGGYPLSGLALHLGAGALLFACALAFALLGQMGGGDVKLIGTIGLWLGFGSQLTLFLVSAAVLSFVFALALIAIRLRPASALAILPPFGWVLRIASGEDAIRKMRGPFGVPLCIAAAYAAWVS